jgi:hypothetical protein
MYYYSAQAEEFLQGANFATYLTAKEFAGCEDKIHLYPAVDILLL